MDLAVAILQLALKLYPDLAAFLSGHAAAGSLPAKCVDAVNAALPAQSPAQTTLDKLTEG
jgi:hypothetical protein